MTIKPTKKKKCHGERLRWLHNRQFQAIKIHNESDENVLNEQ